MYRWRHEAISVCFPTSWNYFFINLKSRNSTKLDFLWISHVLFIDGDHIDDNRPENAKDIRILQLSGIWDQKCFVQNLRHLLIPFQKKSEAQTTPMESGAHW